MYICFISCTCDSHIIFSTDVACLCSSCTTILLCVFIISFRATCADDLATCFIGFHSLDLFVDSCSYRNSVLKFRCNYAFRWSIIHTLIWKWFLPSVECVLCSLRVVAVLLWCVELYGVYALSWACKYSLFYQCIETQSFCAFVKKSICLLVPPRSDMEGKDTHYFMPRYNQRN